MPLPLFPTFVNFYISDNILFGLPYDDDRYKKAIGTYCFIMQCNTFINFFIAVCELNQDLAILPNGDATEIGERYFQIQIINLNTNIILA